MGAGSEHLAGGSAGDDSAHVADEHSRALAHAEPSGATPHRPPPAGRWSASIFTNHSPIRGEYSLGLIATELPHRSAGNTGLKKYASGKFHGAITPITPRGATST